MNEDDEKYLRSIRPVSRTASEEREMLVSLFAKPRPERELIEDDRLAAAKVKEVGLEIEKAFDDAEAKARRSSTGDMPGLSQVRNNEKSLLSVVLPCAWDEGMK